MFNRTNLVVLAIAILVGLAGYSAWQAIAMAGNGTLKLVVAPSDAKATINGRVYSGKSISLKPGSYSVAISRTNFITQTLSTTITKGQTTTLSVSLNTANAVGISQREANLNNQRDAEAIAGANANRIGQEITDDNPILNLLPYKGATYRIGFGASQKYPNDPKAVALYVSGDDDSARTKAQAWIRAQGYNPDDYEIIYQTGD